jgi:hypothetical protein
MATNKKSSTIIFWLKSPTGKYGNGQSIGQSCPINDPDLLKEILESGWGETEADRKKRLEEEKKAKK